MDYFQSRGDNDIAFRYHNLFEFYLAPGRNPNLQTNTKELSHNLTNKSPMMSLIK